jgi:hypothetical protein
VGSVDLRSDEHAQVSTRPPWVVAFVGVTGSVRVDAEDDAQVNKQAVSPFAIDLGSTLDVADLRHLGCPRYSSVRRA